MAIANNDINQPINVNRVAKRGKRMNWRKPVMGLVSLLIVAVVVAGAVMLVLPKNKDGDYNEIKLVKTSELQAVFLTNGQVYFGKVGAINAKYIKLSGIYYLTTNQQVQPTDTSKPANSNVSLVKLGCELHGPEDQMSINRDQITFWENLKSDSQVAKAVAQYKTQNPNGQNCSTPAAKQ